jgi:hypothetical protein
MAINTELEHYHIVVCRESWQQLASMLEHLAFQVTGHAGIQRARFARNHMDVRLHGLGLGLVRSSLLAVTSERDSSAWLGVGMTCSPEDVAVRPSPVR